MEARGKDSVKEREGWPIEQGARGSRREPGGWFGRMDVSTSEAGCE